MSWLYGEPMNDRPFRHIGSGFEFFSERCDFKGDVYVVRPAYETISELDLMKATACMIGYHACNIHRELNGFAGYDSITFTFVTEEESIKLKAGFGLDS